MTLLTIAQDVAKDIGMEVPASMASSTLREHVELLSYLNAAGREVARRADWGGLTASTTLTGAGSAIVHALPAAFSRIVKGVSIKAGASIVRPISRAEWDALTMIEGTPRYCLIEGATIRLWPYLATAATATVYYQADAWCSNGTDAFVADTDTTVVPEDLVTKAAIVRWRRQKGMAYEDYEAEYIAALTDLAEFNNGSRM